MRFLEFDVWSGDQAGACDYRIGHGSAGDQADHAGGDPADDRLQSWPAVVNTWSGHSGACSIARTSSRRAGRRGP
ncbi:hypothetical protein ACWKSP_23810 [Micromonosporaceae bacterium Da 78-11]